MAGKRRRLSGKFHGTASDSILLTFVRVITAVLGLLVTKLLSIHFSLHEYGTYSQAMLVVTTASSFSILGLTNAINYFYNSAETQEEKERYLGTIFSIEYCAGLLCAFLILLMHRPIIQYFKNDDLRNILMFVAWIPLFQNLILMLQVLFVSIGKAKLIAVRNFVVSLARLLIVIVACYVTQSIRTFFIILLILDILQVLYFMWAFSKFRRRISARKIDIKLLKPVFNFCIPMAVYVLTNEFTRDIDKYVVSFFSDSSTLAIYTNAAKLLPFDLITQSFITVLVPIITRQISAKAYKTAQNTFKSYLRLGYLLTWIIAFGVILNAKEAMLFLYDEKYLPGLSVFVIYLFVDMIKFANSPLILTAKGKSKTLMVCSICSLIGNFVLNVLLYQFFDMLGCAIATLLVTSGLVLVLLWIDAKEIETHLRYFFDWKEVGFILVQLIVIGGSILLLKQLIYRYSSNYFLNLVCSYIIFVSAMFLLNRKRIVGCLREINRIK